MQMAVSCCQNIHFYRW